MARAVFATVLSIVIVTVATAVVTTQRASSQAAPPTAYGADVNHDGHVNLTDIIIVAGHYGQTAPLPTATPTSTPTPVDGCYVASSGVLTVCTPTSTATAAPATLRSYDVAREAANDGNPTEVSCALGDVTTGWGSNDEQVMMSALPSLAGSRWSWQFFPNQAVNTQTGHSICVHDTGGLSTYLVGTTLPVGGQPVQVFCNAGDAATGYGFGEFAGYDAGAIGDGYPVTSGAVSGFAFAGNAGATPSVLCLHGTVPIASYVVYFGGLASGTSTVQQCDAGDAAAGFGGSSVMLQNLYNSYPTTGLDGGITGWRFSASAGGGVYLVCLDNPPHR